MKTCTFHQHPKCW